MGTLQYAVTGNGEDESIVVFVAGSAPMVAHSSHPSYAAILDGAREGDESVIDLFDTARAAASRFDRLTERVTAANGRLYFDGDEVNSALAEQVIRFLEDGEDDWLPLVKFFEKVQANPNEHSREQLYEWLVKRDFTITSEGDIIGYKGVRRGADGGYLSVHSGKAMVDGEVITGRIPNPLGAVIEMPRSEVQWDPSVGCHTGLHVGTFEYANSFGDVVLETHVNPRDVVSVPTDSDWQKVRACRYVPVREVASKLTTALVYVDDTDEDDGPDLDQWGDFIC